MKLEVITLILTLIYVQSAVGSDILAVFPLPGRGVNYLYQRLLKGLADTGHTVTSISPYLFDLGISNGSVRDVVLTGFSDKYDRELAELSYENALEPVFTIEKVLRLYNKTLWHRNVREFIKKSKKNHFDVVIIDDLWSDTLLVFSKIFNCPAVIFSSYGNPLSTTLLGNSMSPSYVKHPLLESPNNYMNFKERIRNCIMYFLNTLYNNFYLTPLHNTIIRTAYKKRFNNELDVVELRKKVSLVLLNSHPTFRPPTPLVPNAIEIAGFHIDPPEELFENLQKVLDEATEGVIFFSLGLGVRSRNIPTSKKQLLLNVFKKLNLTVIWKIDGEELPEDLENVFTIRWAPQRDLLAHPNVKLFINQGGYNSLIETVYRGVPTLTLPIFPDELKNSLQAQWDGYSLNLPYKEITEERVYNLIQELLENPKYSNTAKMRSQMFLDRPLKPIDNAVYWMEYVIKYHGADHLKVAAVSLSLVEIYMLDVFGALALLIVMFVFSLKVVYSKTLRGKKCKNQ